MLGDVTDRHPIDNARALAVLAANVASSKKAIDPIVLELSELIGITDYFVICSASNDRLVKTIVEEIEKATKQNFGVKPRAVEGLGDLTWVLIDYGDTVIHVMDEDARSFYGLERLWSDARHVDWESVA